MKSPYKYQNIILHDLFDIKGGGERLAMTLADALDADICYGKHSQDSFDLDKWQHKKLYDLRLNTEIPGLKTLKLGQLFKSKTRFLQHYKNAIYSGVICPLAIQNHLNGRNFYYCHTPPRFVYDKYEYYSSQYSLPNKLLLKTLVSWLKPRYESSVALMDIVFSNSIFVRHRVKKYLNRDSIVIYPPCDIHKFEYRPAQSYYLSTGRLDKLKRIDKIISSFQQMPDKKLVICSTGTDDKRLRKLAQGYDNILFSGQVSDKKLSILISESIATIYIPEDEDFGISPVESMAAGKPVICSGHGGPTETVINGETGLYIDEENIIESLKHCVQKLDTNTAAKMKKACEDRAENFSSEKFANKINSYVNS